MIYQATKSYSQLRYKPTSDSNKTFYNIKETPFSNGLGLLIHKKTRSKDIANILASLTLSINYKKVLRIEADIANAVIQRALENNGVYVPPSIQAGLPAYFVVDNCNFKTDTANGKNEFHGTAQIVYQQSSANVVSEKLQIDHNQNRSLNYDPFPASQVCPKPKPKNEIYSQFAPKNKDTDLYRKWDCISGI